MWKHTVISSLDRSGWFGASDTARIMGRWDTPTFARWWLEKLGLVQNHYKSLAMLAGTHYEHRILGAMGIRQRDRQIRIPALRLRVNLDGEVFDTIKEVKTYSGERFTVSKPYWMQMQVEMFAGHAWGEIIAYRLLDEDYINFFNPIDHERLSAHPVAYAPGWVGNEYLPRLEYLAWCLKRRKTPCSNEFSPVPRRGKSCRK